MHLSVDSVRPFCTALLLLHRASYLQTPEIEIEKSPE